MMDVEYIVLKRYISPYTNKPVDNCKLGYKSFFAKNKELTQYSEFEEKDVPESFQGENRLESYIQFRSLPSSPENNMLFTFKGTKCIEKYSQVNSQYSIYADTFEQVKGDPWIIESIKGSLLDATREAENLAKKIGMENVKVVKNVPIDMKIDIR